MSHAAAASAHAAMINAVKASGVVVQVEPEEFRTLLTRARDPLVVYTEGGILSTHYRYLMSYKGLAFSTRSPEPLPMPSGAETVHARKIWMP
jgi:hypothetical protein